MSRPLFYVLILFLHGLFWLIILLTNYTAYTSHSPEAFNDDIMRIFVANRFLLILAELIFPLIMLVGTIILLVAKFRPMPVRIPMLLMLFMGTEFWVWRTFWFRDRMETYHLANLNEGYFPSPYEGHQFPLIGFAIVFLLVLSIREYQDLLNPLDRAMANLKENLRRGNPVD